MGDYGFEGAGEFGGQDENFNCLPDKEAFGRASDRTDALITELAETIKTLKSKPIRTEYSTSFTVFPHHTNYNDPPSVFGGKMLAEMDNAAAMCVRRGLYGTGCTDAVTVGVTGVAFHRPAYIGEIVHIKAKITALGTKSVTVMVMCERENKKGEVHIMSKGMFTFCARKNGEPSEHGLEMP